MAPDRAILAYVKAPLKTWNGRGLPLNGQFEIHRHN